MKHLKMLGLAAVAAAALTAFAGAGTASANTVLCETTITTGCAAAGWDWNVNAEIDFSLQAGGTLRYTDTSGFIAIITCTGGTGKGKVERTTTPMGNVGAANVTTTGCTSSVSTITGGELEMHHIAGTHNGTMITRGFATTIKFGSATCAYTNPGGTGTLVTSADGLDAVVSVNNVLTLVPEHSSAQGCPSSARVTGTATQTTGTTKLYVAES